MAKNKKAEETRTSIDNLNDSLTNLGSKVKDNMKAITTVSAIIGIVAVVIIGYIFLIHNPSVDKAEQLAATGDFEYMFNQNDSIALVSYKAAAEQGHDAGNRARLMIGMIDFDNENYEEAIAYLSEYDANEPVTGAAAYSLLGDCYVNSDNLPKAIEAFEKAIKVSDNNPYYTPLFIIKLANIRHSQGDYAAEADLYQQIVDKYPQYLTASVQSRMYGQASVDVEKLLARAKALAGK